jgi:cytochrome P450
VSHTTRPEARTTGGPALAGRIRLSSFADVDEVFKSRDFVQAGGGHGGSSAVYGGTLLSLSGEAHFERRRMESVLFRQAALAEYEERVLVPALRQALAARAAQRGADGLVRADLLPLVRSTVLRLSARIAGLDDVDDQALIDRLYTQVLALTAAANVEYATGGPDGVIQAGRSARAAFARDFFAPAWARREAAARAGKSPDPPSDLLWLLVQQRACFQGWPDDVLVNEAILFVVASSGSPTNASMHVVTELLGWLARHPEGRVRLAEPGFLRGAICEVLRLHPGVPYQLRRAARDTRLQSGRHIPAGTCVELDVRSASRDASAFGPHPERFDPDRQVAPPAMAFGFTFGGGPHTCMGRGLTLGETARGYPSVGMLACIARELLGAGIELDPGDPIVRTRASSRDEYARFPVIFRNL